MEYNFKEIKSFTSPLWYKNHKELLYLDSYCDMYLKEDNGFGSVNHSTTLTADKNFKELTDLVGAAAVSFLDKQGFDMSEYTTMFTELWVQQFSRSGGGYHETHTHCNQHVSGFYFLKCDEETSYPVFYDPRPGAMMNKLKEKDKDKITDAVSSIVYRPNPGDLVLFDSYMPHSFVVDSGKSPFRFIHFNLQAFPKQAVNNR
tara:strand:+ start:5418 stop:6023 length:606 start_codon:yes stop_codon:yes gene_type:complete